MALSQEVAADPRVTLAMAEFVEFDNTVLCPICGRSVQSDVGTPSVPSHILADGDLAEQIGEEVPVFGWRCRRHRSHEVQVLSPADLAPEGYATVTAAVDGEGVEIAVPQPALPGGDGQ